MLRYEIVQGRVTDGAGGPGSGRLGKACEEEEAFLQTYKPQEYPPFAFTVDLAIFTLREGALSVLLVERGGQPFKGSWALPGGFVGVDEAAEAAAYRELQEETGLALTPGVHLEELRTFSAPGRDPRMRVVSCAWVALLPHLPEVVPGDDAAQARWWPVDDVLGPEAEVSLAFDHEEILTAALERVRNKLEYTTLATSFLPEVFTISDLRRVYRAVWGVEPHLANFRRKVLGVEGFLEPVGTTSSGAVGPRALLYRAGPATSIQPALLRQACTQGSSPEED